MSDAQQASCRPAEVIAVLMLSNQDALIARLERHGGLPSTAHIALGRISTARKSLERGTYIVREADTPHRCAMLLSGYAIRQKVTGQGARQIVAISLPGDIIDLQNLYLDLADHSVQMITDGEVMTFQRRMLQDIASTEPAVTRAVMSELLIDGSIMREWLTNNGRRSAKARIAHLICELCIRLSKEPPTDVSGFKLPINQEGLGDALGLTSAHVNRMIKELTREGLLSWTRWGCVVPDWKKLKDVGDFTSQYLHLDQMSNS